MTADSTHECPAPHCTVRCEFDRFACRAHWYQIPPALRTRLWREWSRRPGEASYFEVRAECLLALGVPADEIAAVNAGVGLPVVEDDHSASRRVDVLAQEAPHLIAPSSPLEAEARDA